MPARAKVSSSASWRGRWCCPQGLRLGAEGLQLPLASCGQLALVFLAPADRAVVMVLGLGRIAQLMVAHGQEESVDTGVPVDTEVLVGCPLLGFFERLDCRLPFS